VTDTRRHLALRRDETRARIADGELHPVEVTMRMRIAGRAIRAKRRLAHALTSASAVKHENNFVAKTRDSESAHRLHDAIVRVAACFIALITRDVCAQDMTCCIGFSCNRCACRRRRCEKHLQSQTRVSACRQIKRGWRTRAASSTLP
jgi:hypothetical protein